LLADLETVEKSLQRAEKQAKTNEKKAVAWRNVLARVLAGLEAGTAVRQVGLSAEDQEQLKPLHLITAKPAMYVANVDESGNTDNPYVAAVLAKAEQDRVPAVVICAALEAELARLAPADQAEFLADLGLEEPGLERMIAAGYKLLGLQTFYTAGPKEVRAWTVRKGAAAPEAAGQIHTDFQRGFIRAEIIGYDNFIKRNGEQGAKAAGEMRLEGKEYIVAEGDVIHFRFNV
jgi:GTP-binding protein YchF